MHGWRWNKGGVEFILRCRMKIALAILNADPARGGAERYTLDLARALHERGNEVYLLATRFARDVEPARQVRLDGAAGSRTGRYRLFIDSLDEHLKHTTYDIVHAMLPVRTCDIYHPHAGIEAHNLEQGHLRHPNPIRQTITRLTNQLNRKRRLYAEVERKLLEERRAVVLCLSHAMEQVAQEHYDLREGQSQVLINGVDLDRYDPASHQRAHLEVRKKHSLADGDVVAMLMSNNYRLKGLRQAIVALQRLVERGYSRAKLLVVGRESTDEYHRLARKLGIEANVVFAGPTTDAQAYYAACDLFVLPTAYDSCSLVVLEALAMGRPVITTRRNGACEAMTDGVHGFVIDNQSDLEGLTETWQSLLNDALRSKMSQAALDLRQKLSWECYISKLLQIYGQVRRPHPEPD